MTRGIIVAAFGTSYRETRENCIEPVVKEIHEALPDLPMEMAFTSRIIKKKLWERDGEHVHDERGALKALQLRGAVDIRIQPLHIIPGHEYEKLTRLGLAVGAPLMHPEVDWNAVVDSLEPSEKPGVTLWIGHGTDHAADALYDQLELALNQRGTSPSIVGTIEGEKDLEAVLEELRTIEAERILLRPLMLVAGDHVIHDIASDEGDSWKSRLERAGYQVELDLRGLGELKGIRELFRKRAEELMAYDSKLNVIGTGPGASDLITLRALKALEESELIFVPDNKGKNMALDTVQPYIEGKKIIRIPIPMMRVTEEDYNYAARLIEEEGRGKICSFITIGDALTYSTAIYILERLSADISVEIIPGIPSYIAAFDRCQMPLTVKGERFLLVDQFEELPEDLLAQVDSIAVLKTNHNPKELFEELKGQGFDPRYVQRVSLAEEKVVDWEEELSLEKDYMSLVIGRRGKGGYR